MTISIEEVQVETVETPAVEAREPQTRPRVPDMDRIRFELRRDASRLERLWAD